MFSVLKLQILFSKYIIISKRRVLKSNILFYLNNMKFIHFELVYYYTKQMNHETSLLKIQFKMKNTLAEYEIISSVTQS